MHFRILGGPGIERERKYLTKNLQMLYLQFIYNALFSRIKMD